MTEFTRIAVDTSKHVFTLHGIDAGAAQFCAAICAGPRSSRFSPSWRRRRW